MQSELDLLAAMVARLDARGRILAVNSAMETALGSSRRKLYGLSFLQFLHDGAALTRALMVKGRKRYDLTEFRFEATIEGLGHRRLNHGDAAQHVHVHLSGPDSDGEWFLELWPRQEVARGLHDAQMHEVAETNRMLLRNLAHEIKNPLGGIRGAAQLLGMDIREPELLEYTQVIIHEADRLQVLVDRLLQPHRHQLRVESVNIHEVCEHVRSLVLLEYPEGLTIEQNYDISLPELQGDRSQLVQALLNIVQNAALVLRPKIVHEQAHIELRTRVARQVCIGSKLSKLALELRVKDNGPGIDPSIRERIFHPLVTGRAEGTGLGLSLAQTFIQRHGGIVECESEPGRTAFLITIPLP